MIKRFIAGVVCPKCAAEDSIKAWRDEEAKLMHRECVDCGYTDALSLIVNQPDELETRVTEIEQKIEVEVQNLTIFDPHSKADQK